MKMTLLNSKQLECIEQEIHSYQRPTTKISILDDFHILFMLDNILTLVKTIHNIANCTFINIID